VPREAKVVVHWPGDFFSLENEHAISVHLIIRLAAATLRR